jgi:hypothetical protein
MTAAIPEAVSAAEGATGRGAAARAAGGRHRKIPTRVEAGRARRAAEAERAQQGAQTRQRFIDYGGRGARYGREARLPGGGYQGAILAEFLIAVLVVSFMPLASGAPSDGKTGPSPYRVNDLEQLAAIGITYFLLALLAQGDHGKMAAWFGGLILLGIGFKKMMSGQFSAAVSGLQGKPPPAEAGPYADTTGGGGGGHAVTASEES